MDEDKIVEKPCKVCGKPTPINEYCENECWTLDITRWSPTTVEQDVVASILGKVHGNGIRLVEAVNQIHFLYTSLNTTNPKTTGGEAE